MIRRAEISDTEEIIKVWQESSKLAHSFLEPDFFVEEVGLIRNVYLPKAATWVFEIGDNSIVGFISMLENEVGALFVKPDYQSQGYGKMLLNFVKDNYKDLYLEVFKKNIDAYQFYSKYGFTPVSERIHVSTNQLLVKMRLSSEEYNTCE